MYDINHTLAIIALMNQSLPHLNAFSKQIQVNASFEKKNWLILIYSAISAFKTFKFNFRLEIQNSFSLNAINRQKQNYCNLTAKTVFFLFFVSGLFHLTSSPLPNNVEFICNYRGAVKCNRPDSAIEPTIQHLPDFLSLDIKRMKKGFHWDIFVFQGKRRYFNKKTFFIRSISKLRKSGRGCIVDGIAL